MRYDQAVGDAVRLNGAEQHYACCTAFLGHEPEHRLSTEDLCRNHVLARAQGIQVFEVVPVAGRAWVVQGSNLVLRPTPEYARVTQVGIEEPYVWCFDGNNLHDQVDDICMGGQLRLVAVQLASDRWSAAFRGRRDGQRLPRFEGPTLAVLLVNPYGVVRGIQVALARAVAVL